MESKSYIEKILSSEDSSKKEKLMECLSNIIDKYNSEDKEEIERKLYELAEGKVLNEERARHLIEKMKPFGKKWELADTGPIDFWIVMNSAYNDYNDIFKEDVGLYARFSKDFIMDEDAVEDKVYYYFTMIPKE